MSTDFELFDAVYKQREGSTILRLHPKFQNQTASTPDERLFIPPGVTKVLATWNNPLRNARCRWIPVNADKSFAGSWIDEDVIIDSGQTRAMIMFTIATDHGAYLQASTIGPAGAAEVGSGYGMGIEVYPSVGGAS